MLILRGATGETGRDCAPGFILPLVKVEVEISAAEVRRELRRMDKRLVLFWMLVKDLFRTG